MGDPIFEGNNWKRRNGHGISEDEGEKHHEDECGTAGWREHCFMQAVDRIAGGDLRRGESEI
jgi:hypothetical protein